VVNSYALESRRGMLWPPTIAFYDDLIEQRRIGSQNSIN
jgi:hypothetical protein